MQNNKTLIHSVHLFLFFSHVYLYCIYIKMISPRNVELPLWYGQWLAWGFKPVLSYSKPHTFSTFIGEEN